MDSIATIINESNGWIDYSFRSCYEVIKFNFDDDDDVLIIKQKFKLFVTKSKIDVPDLT